MKNNTGYIIGKGSEFFGNKYEELLEKVYSKLDLLNDQYKIIYSKKEVHNVSIIPVETFKIQNLKKEELVKNEDIVQIWFETSTEHIQEIKNLSDYCYSKLRTFYSQKYLFSSPSFNYTLYNKDCFIANHKDGYDNYDKRLCVLLLYLNKDWEKGLGGELIITTNDGEKIEIEPTFGNIAILDFRTANLEHEVKKITSDIFNRKALVSFIMKEDNINYKEN